LVVFGGVLGVVFLEVDFQFLLILWVLGFELLAKGIPWGTPTIPKVPLYSVEWIRTSIEVKVDFIPWVEFFTTAKAKLTWPVSETGQTGFPSSGLSRGILGKQVFLC
jgi:hypothetical protein